MGDQSVGDRPRPAAVQAGEDGRNAAGHHGPGARDAGLHDMAEGPAPEQLDAGGRDDCKGRNANMGIQSIERGICGGWVYVEQ